MENQNYKVYYDGLCHLCSKEMNQYKKIDKEKKISFIDITAKDFNAEDEKLDRKKVQDVLHVRNNEGKLLTGVDSFISIWDTLGIMQPLSTLAKNKFLRPFFDIGYISFAKARPYLPKKKCPDNSCDIA